jgi:hypothetical protein
MALFKVLSHVLCDPFGGRIDRKEFRTPEPVLRQGLPQLPPEIPKVRRCRRVIPFLDPREIEACPDILRTNNNKMEVHRSPLLRFDGNDPIVKEIPEEICPQGIESTLSFLEIGNVLSEGQGQESDPLDPVLSRQSFDILNQSKSVLFLAGRKAVDLERPITKIQP